MESADETVNAMLEDASRSGRAEEVAYIKLQCLIAFLVRSGNERNEDFLEKCGDLCDAAISFYQAAVVCDTLKILLGESAPINNKALVDAEKRLSVLSEGLADFYE